MKLLRCLISIAALALPVTAGESALTVTWQPLDGLGSGVIQIVPVTCHDWYSHGTDYSAIGLITAANVPPTNNTAEAKDNLNVASLYGLKFVCDEEPKVPVITMDLTGFSVPEGGYTREEVVKSSLECLRRCLPKALKKSQIQLKAKDEDKPWAEKILKEFNSRDRSKEFYKPEE